MGSMQLVTISVQLDEDAIRQDSSLDQWWKTLGLHEMSAKQEWSVVFKEVASILVGAPIYAKFSHTAYQDVERFSRYMLSQEKDAKEHKPNRVASTPPPPPPSNGRKPVAKTN